MSEPHQISSETCKDSYPGCRGCPYGFRDCPDAKQLKRATGVDARVFFRGQLTEEELRRTMRGHLGLKDEEG